MGASKIRHPILGALAASLLVGCPPAELDKQQVAFWVDVEVRGGLAGEIGVPLDDALVSLKLPGEEAALAHGFVLDGSLGWYRAVYSFEDASRAAAELVLAVEAAGYTPKYLRVPPLEADAGGDPLIVRAILYPTVEFETRNLFRLSMFDQRVSVTLPPEEAATGLARLFEPETDADGIPGSLMDTRGRHLGIGVFSSVTLGDDAGGLVSEADEGTILRMRLPRSSWPSLVAIEPGDNFIEPGDNFIEPGDNFLEPGDNFLEPGDNFQENDPINTPVYALDPTTGRWSFEAVGWLEDSPGSPITMGNAGDNFRNIRDGNFEGSVFVAAPAQHFSYWGLAWPLEGQVPVGGILRSENGESTSGLTVSARGVDRPISVSPAISDKDGRFCLFMPPPIEGRAYGARLEISFVGETEDEGGYLGPSIRTVELGSFEVTRDMAGDSCLPDQSDLEWTVDLNGRWRFVFTESEGAPEDDANGYDPVDDTGGGVAVGSSLPLCGLTVSLQHELDSSELLDQHLSLNARLPFASRELIDACQPPCLEVEEPGPDGIFSIMIPESEVVDLFAELRAHHGDSMDVLSGRLRLTGCEEQPARITLSEGFHNQELFVRLGVETDGRHYIEWDRIDESGEPIPGIADMIEVVSKNGDPKWIIAGEGADRPASRVYYEEPNAAMQLFPRGDEPPSPLVEGDLLHVSYSEVIGGVIINHRGSVEVVRY